MPGKPQNRTRPPVPNKPRPARSPAKAPVAKSAGRPARQAVDTAARPPLIPGEILLADEAITAFAGRPSITLTVVNHGDRPIQVGSHCHFFETNRALRFPRERAFGFRLKIPSGTAVRFEPGEEKHVSLVAFGGNRIAYGINGLTNGSLDDARVKAQALARAAEQGFVEEEVSR